MKDKTGYSLLRCGARRGNARSISAIGEPLLNNRQPMERLISKMVDAYSQGGEKGFSEYLATAMKFADATESSFAKHIRMMQQQSGIEGALGYLKIRLQSATKHDKTTKRCWKASDPIFNQKGRLSFFTGFFWLPHLRLIAMKLGSFATAFFLIPNVAITVDTSP